jgi:septal ring factor EnvC (AmiA/AmiB activator)
MYIEYYNMSNAVLMSNIRNNLSHLYKLIDQDNKEYATFLSSILRRLNKLHSHVANLAEQNPTVNTQLQEIQTSLESLIQSTHENMDSQTKLKHQVMEQF